MHLAYFCYSRKKKQRQKTNSSFFFFFFCAQKSHFTKKKSPSLHINSSCHAPAGLRHSPPNNVLYHSSRKRVLEKAERGFGKTESLALENFCPLSSFCLLGVWVPKNKNNSSGGGYPTKSNVDESAALADTRAVPAWSRAGDGELDR